MVVVVEEAAGVGWRCEGVPEAVPEAPDCDVDVPWGVLPVLD